MSKRIFTGNRAGTYGLWVSPSGIEADTADEFLLAFSSTFAHMQRVTQGSFFMPIHSNHVGDDCNIQQIPYGQTFSKPPIVAASMLASFHQANFNGTLVTQYNDLDNVSHTPVWEGITNYAGGHNNIWTVDVGPASSIGTVALSFGSIVFGVDVFLSYCQFRCVNMYTNAQIRYAIFKPQDI